MVQAFGVGLGSLGTAPSLQKPAATEGLVQAWG